ncbi:MAG: DUF4160 domain-containing protein [Gemmatimonadaceae bacterium]|nr:DUF4160 domain-containing protein [Gemmatimonadaceae bacterium]
MLDRLLSTSRAVPHRDHDPPYLHAMYGEYEVTGRFPRRALVLVLEWLHLHRNELMVNWERARARELLVAIAPLE